MVLSTLSPSFLSGRQTQFRCNFQILSVNCYIRNFFSQIHWYCLSHLKIHFRFRDLLPFLFTPHSVLHFNAISFLHHLPKIPIPFPHEYQLDYGFYITPKTTDTVMFIFWFALLFLIRIFCDFLAFDYHNFIDRSTRSNGPVTASHTNVSQLPSHGFLDCNYHDFFDCFTNSCSCIVASCKIVSFPQTTCSGKIFISCGIAFPNRKAP